MSRDYFFAGFLNQTSTVQSVQEPIVSKFFCALVVKKTRIRTTELRIHNTASKDAGDICQDPDPYK